MSSNLTSSIYDSFRTYTFNWIRLLLIFSFSILFCYNYSQAQISQGDDIYVFKRDIDDGLSQNIVISLAKDSLGIIWIGTLDGINAFDGQHFEEMGQYKLEKGPHNDYYEIHPASNGILYTKRDDGLHELDFRTKSWSQSTELKNSIAVLCNSRNEIILCNRENQLFEASHDRVHLDHKSVSCDFPATFSQPKIIEDTLLQNYYLLSYNGQVTKYDSSFNCIGFVDLEKYGEGFVDAVIVQDRIWIISYSGAFISVSKDLQDLNFLGQDFSEFNVEHFSDLHHAEGKVYLCADQVGLFIFDQKKGQWSHHMVRLLDNPQGEHEYVIRVLSDGDRLYFGSTTNGLLIHDQRQINFYNIPEIDIYNSTIFDLKLPRKIMEDERKNIWISTTGQGLWAYNSKERNTKHYTSDSHPTFLRSNSIRQIKAVENRMWIGYNGLGIDLVDLSTKKIIKSLSLKTTGFSDNVIINDFYIDQQGELWVATNEQGIFLVKENYEIEHFHQENSPLKANEIYNIKKLNGELYLISFAGELHKVDEFENTIEHIATPLSNFRYSIKCLETDLDGNIWLGTAGQGIIKVDQNFNPLDTLSIASGDLLSDELCIIIRDEIGNMWVGSNKGLVLFKRIDNTYYNVRTYLKNDGLHSNEFMTGAYLLDSDHNIWMGNISGVNVWNSNIAQNSSEELDIYIRSIIADDFTNENLLNGQDLGVFPNKTSNINVSFSTIGFCAIDNINYKLKLEGFDDQWRDLGTRDYQEFLQLPSGDYILKIKSTNYDGVWSEKIHEWPISIKQNLWDKWWFYLILALIVLAVALYLGRRYSHYKVGKELERNEREKDRILMEMNSLRSQINPHFLFNTLSSINNFIVNNEKNIASEYLVKFSRLIRTILNHNSRKLINLEDEMKALSLYIEIEQMRLGDSFDYFINFHVQAPLSSYSMPPLILQPVVENAIWHGLTHKEGNQILSIDITDKEDYLIVTVRDNGIGRKKSAEISRQQKDRSYGMEITTKRLQLWFDQNSSIKKDFIKIVDLAAEDGSPSGTEVEIYLPKISNHEFEEKLNN